MPVQPPVLLTEIIQLLEGSQSVSTAGQPAGNKVIVGPASLRGAGAGSIIWIAPGRADTESLLSATAARTVIGDESLRALSSSFPDKTFVIVEAPRLTFIRICAAFFAPKAKAGIHPSAVIDAEAEIHAEAWIGPGCVIGKCSIGAGSQLMGNCFLYDSVTVGSNVTIHAGTVIGADGFGYQRNESGEFEKFPHLGGVVVEDDVEIGSNTCIDRGTLDDTVIRKGAKIDNLVHIAHNVVVGEHAAVIALAMVGGSTQIGDGAWVAPSAALRDGLSIGAGATIGMGAVVTKPVPPGETWTGNPARELSAFLTMQQKLK